MKSGLKEAEEKAKGFLPTPSFHVLPTLTQCFVLSIFAMSLAGAKRPYTQNDDADIEAAIGSPVAKVFKTNNEHPSHAFFLLEHSVRVVLPEKCQDEDVKAYYQAQLNDPKGTIAE